MKFRHLLHQRDALLRDARLANLAYAYHRLADFGTRIARAQLRGPATLHVADAAAERPWPLLLAHDGHQSVIDEHFLDEDIAELADILAFLHEGEPPAEFTFHLEEFAGRFLPALREELTQAGVAPEEATVPSERKVE